MASRAGSIRMAGREHAGQNAASERLQFLAGLEAHSLAGRDADFLAGPWIPPDACLARADVEHTEAAQLNPLSLAESRFHGFEDGLDGLLRFGPGHAGLVYHRVYNVELDHTRLPIATTASYARHAVAGCQATRARLRCA